MNFEELTNTQELDNGSSLKNKSYRKLYLWFAASILLFILMGIFISPDRLGFDVWIKCFMEVLMIDVYILIYMVHTGDYCYWVNGVSYEEALKATKARRYKYTYKYLVRFSYGLIAMSGYVIIGLLLDSNIAIDLTYGLLVIGATAFSTINFKL